MWPHEVLIEALKRDGRPTRHENGWWIRLRSMHGFDLGLGAEISFGKSEHQGIHKIWGTQLNELGKFEPIDLE